MLCPEQKKHGFVETQWAFEYSVFVSLRVWNGLPRSLKRDQWLVDETGCSSVRRVVWCERNVSWCAWCYTAYAVVIRRAVNVS